MFLRVLHPLPDGVECLTRESGLTHTLPSARTCRRWAGQASAWLRWHMAAAVAMPSAIGDASPSCAIAAYDAAQQAAMRQELAIIQQKYFTPESTFPGLPIDPEGGTGRAAAQGKKHKHLSD